MARTLPYGYLDTGFASPKAVNDWVLVEVVGKDPYKKSASGIIYNPIDAGENKAYFIVREVSPDVQRFLPELKPGDVIEGGGTRMVSFMGPNDIRYGLVLREDIAVIYSKIAEVEEPSKASAPPPTDQSGRPPLILSSRGDLD
jgi:hypothetical protein